MSYSGQLMTYSGRPAMTEGLITTPEEVIKWKEAIISHPEEVVKGRGSIV